MRSKKTSTGNKRNFRDYHSSDYGNEEEEDYGQDYNDSHDEFDNPNDAKQSQRQRKGQVDSGDSDFSGDEGAFKSSKRKHRRTSVNQEDKQSSGEDTIEEEDPFSPEVDLILADKIVEEPAPSGLSANNQTGKNVQHSRQQTPVIAPRIHNEFLVKFMDQSYLHVKWMTEQQLEEYSYKGKQKIRRYFQQKEKKRLMTDQLSRQAINFLKPGDQGLIKAQQAGLRGKGGLNHHFSDDEEEDEDGNEAMIDVAELNIPPLDDPLVLENALNANSAPQEPPKPNYIAVQGPSGEDLLQYFDKNYVAVERVVSTTIIFPVIHPRQAKQIRGKWQEDCLNVVNVLINYRKNNVSIGLAFAEQLDPENEGLASYFKVIKQPIDLTIITNRLYNRSYQHPQDFWADLGLVFKNCRQYHQSKKVALRKQCEVLRCLAYNLYKDWHSEQKARLKNGNVISHNNQANLQPHNDQQQKLKAQTSNTQYQNIEEIQNVPQQQHQQPGVSIKINLQSLLINQKQNQEMRQPDTSRSLEINQHGSNAQQHQQSFQAPQNLPKFNNILPSIPNQQMNMQNNGFNSQTQLMQQSHQNIMNQNQIQQIDWMQGGTNQGLGIQMQNPMFSSNGMLPSLQQTIDFNTNRPIQLPSIGQLNQGMLMQNQGILSYPGSLLNINNMGMLPSLTQFSNPYGHQLMALQAQQQQPYIDMNIIQAINNLQGLTVQDKNNLINQIFTGQLPASIISQLLPGYNNPIQNQYEAMALMGQGGGPQDYNSISQIGIRGSQAHTQQLPPINQVQGLNQIIGNPTQQFQLPSISQIPQNKAQVVQQQFVSGMQTSLPRLNTMNTTQNNILPSLEEFSIQGGVHVQGGSATNSTFNPFQSSTQASQLNTKFANPQVETRFNKFQKIGPDDQIDQNGNQVDKQDGFIPPAIIDPGQFSLSWLLAPGDILEELDSCPYLTPEEIKSSIQNKRNVDQLYLVKWRGLSYSQCSWEPESVFKAIFDEKVQDYNRYNRSLDQYQRDRLDQLIKNHKKMLRFTEKKTQGQGHKKIDPIMEGVQSLQEAKINRQLLNQKIEEIMGEMYYQVVQYNVANGQVPKFKKPHQQLKKYQVAGLNWLIRAWHEHRNVVLADEMGLGKTIMTLSLFDHLNKVCKLRGPFLILAPLTTLEHWKRIADDWTSMNSILYYDPNSGEGREQIRNWEWYFTDVTYKGTVTQKSELYKFNIMITSFEVFMSDLNPIIQQIPFAYIVVDEAHRLKNKQAKTLKLLKDHPCKRILLLTGTPVQNNTKELWTLLNYIEPEKFNNMDAFLEQYGNLESFEQIQKLHSILKPHFLRRLKEEVEDSIPPLNETVVEVGLTNLQNTYYKGIYGENRMVLAKFGTNSIKTSQLNNMDVQLRKCCNHLFLLKGVEEELTRDCKTDEDLYNKLLESSGKLMLLDKFIEKFKKENHKMLIFSQFKRMLDIIELYLRMKGISYEKLTGSVKNQDRVSAIQRFNNDGGQNSSKENNFGVFLLTTRAGGLGINLTSARVVIIFDSDWNPQNDLQAIARAHRIGQKFEVQVYRLITSKTYEEQMFERASKKLGMEQALFSKGAFNQDTNAENIAMEGGLQLRALTDLKQDSKEIENLLKYGAYAFMDNGEGQNGDDFINLKNKDIDEILATGKKKEFQYNKGVYTLQKSTFNASKYERGNNLPDVNDPEFWNKVLPYDQIMSITVLEKKFKKEKKEICKSESEQTEFIKDLEIVFNDFMDAKFDNKITAASKKQIESDEETLREMLKKLVKLTGMRLQYVERCKEWLREMLRTSKRKKPIQIAAPEEKSGAALIPEEDEEAAGLEEDDIIMYDSDNEGKRPLRKRQVNPGEINRENSFSQSLNNINEGKKKNSDSYEEEKEGYSHDLGTGFMRRSQRQRKPARNEFGETQNAGEPFDDIDEAFTLKKGGYKRRVGRPSLEEAEDLSAEERYGLRGRKKRQKNDEIRDNTNTNKPPQNSLNLQDVQNELASSGKNTHVIMKRNEKNGIVCAVCWKPETTENPCVWFCHKYCQRSFHEQCKNKIFAEKPDSRKVSPNGYWECEDCSENTAECFCCKKKGAILVFPKKGKPKAAGFGIFLNEIFPAGGENGNVIEDEENIEENNDKDKLNQESDIQPEDNQDSQDKQSSPMVEQVPKNIIPTRIKFGSEDEQIQDDEISQVSPEIIIKLNQAEEKQQQEEKESRHSADQENIEEEKDNNNGNDPLNTDKGDQDHQMAEIQAIQFLNSLEEPDPNDSKYVVRCTLGGCFKYYHVKCVYRNKNVSCINSMKVQRFRCPLHYCEICQASGDSVLIVQCVACPTAYHVKCIPKGDPNAIKLTKKYVVCKRHNLSPNDFPRFEERMTSFQVIPQQPRANGASLNSNIAPTASEGMLDNQGKPPPKKRGRKPKSYYAELEAQQNAQKQLALGRDIVPEDIADPGSVANRIQNAPAHEEDDNEEEVKMPWNNKPPSGGEDLECQDEFHEDRQDEILTYQPQQVLTPAPSLKQYLQEARTDQAKPISNNIKLDIASQAQVVGMISESQRAAFRIHSSSGFEEPIERTMTPEEIQMVLQLQILRNQQGQIHHQRNPNIQ